MYSNQRSHTAQSHCTVTWHSNLITISVHGKQTKYPHRPLHHPLRRPQHRPPRPRNPFLRPDHALAAVRPRHRLAQRKGVRHEGGGLPLHAEPRHGVGEAAELEGERVQGGAVPDGGKGDAVQVGRRVNAHAPRQSLFYATIPLGTEE